MSKQSRQSARLVKVKVEPVEVKVEVDDEERILEDSSHTTEGTKGEDKDVEMLKAVASLLRTGSWLSRGAKGGQELAQKLLSLRDRLVGWKEWEVICRSKDKENRDLAQRIKEIDLQYEVVKASKSDLRKTYKVERRKKLEREAAELRKKIAHCQKKSVKKEVQEVAVQTINSVMLSSKTGKKKASAKRARGDSDEKKISGSESEKKTTATPKKRTSAPAPVKKMVCFARPAAGTSGSRRSRGRAAISKSYKESLEEGNFSFSSEDEEEEEVAKPVPKAVVSKKSEISSKSAGKGMKKAKEAAKPEGLKGKDQLNAEKTAEAKKQASSRIQSKSTATRKK